MMSSVCENVNTNSLTMQQSKWVTVKLLFIGVALTSITNFPSAFTHTSVNSAMGEVNDYLNTSYVERGDPLQNWEFVLMRSIINSCWYAGQVLGALISPYVIDKYGRKFGYILATIMMTLACGLQSLSTLLPYPELLVLGRMIASFFSPMSDNAAILYFQEVPPTNLRGVISSLFGTGYAVMALFGVVVGMERVLGHSLTLLLSVPVIPGILSVLFLIFIPETPKYLAIVRGDRKEAINSLNFYHGKDANHTKTLILYDQEGSQEQSLMNGKVQEPVVSQWSVITELFTKKLQRRALMCAFMVTVPALAFYPILQSSTYFFQKLNFNEHVSQTASTAMMCVLVVACIFGTVFVKYFPRRILVLCCGSMATACLIVFVACATLTSHYESAKFGAVAAMFGYVISYGFGIGPISHYLGTELTDLKYRSALYSVSFSLNNVLIVIASFTVQQAYEVMGAWCFVFLFIIPSILALIFVYLYLPETKDREPHQVQAELLCRRPIPRHALQRHASRFSAVFPLGDTIKNASSKMILNGADTTSVEHERLP